MPLIPICQLGESDGMAMSALHAKGFSRPWPAADMAQHTGRDLVLGARDEGGHLLAFIILSRAADQAEILTLITDPDARRAGLAGRLLAEAEQRLIRQRTALVFLEVAEDNAAAMNLYKKAGYQPVGRRPGYYRREGGRVTALNLRKRLDVMTG